MCTECNVEYKCDGGCNFCACDIGKMVELILMSSNSTGEGRYYLQCVRCGSPVKVALSAFDLVKCDLTLMTSR